MRAAAGATLLLAALVATACSTTRRVPPHPNLDGIWHDYVQLPPKRALAVAGDPDRIWVGAAAGGAESQVDASDRALEECRRKRRERRMQAPCLLYAVGDDILW